MVPVTSSFRPVLWDEWKQLAFLRRPLPAIFRRCHFSGWVSLPFKEKSSAGGWCQAQSSSYCGDRGGLSAAWWLSAALQSTGVSAGDSERPSRRAHCCFLAFCRESNSPLTCFIFYVIFYFIFLERAIGGEGEAEGEGARILSRLYAQRRARQGAQSHPEIVT